MLALLGTSLAAVYLLCALCLLIYTSGHGVLLWKTLRWGHRQHAAPLQQISPDSLPHVTIQLPIYNEQYVVLRLLDAVAAQDYPAEKLHVQILDDSSDSTTGLIAQHIRRIAQRHPKLQIDHIRRSNRSGYKAGALAYGLSLTDSPFIAIFDADFVPAPDFLQRTIPPLLQDARLAVVQTRWGHLNRAANALTRAQALSIDAHFLIEQAGRSAAKWPLPFNGTGGVWRAAAIQDAGGWSAQTLTEDLDLSMRAQLRGWRALLLPDVTVPGELPPQIAAYRQQQIRWAQGSSQNLRRLLFPLWRSYLSLPAKIMATHYLAQYLPQLWMLILLLLAPPLLLLDALPMSPLAPLGIISLIPPLLYIVSQQMQGGDWVQRLLAFPALLLLGSGLIARNSWAVLRGIFVEEHEPTFLRTPKFAQEWQGSPYALHSALPLVELLLGIYALWGAYLALIQVSALLPYLLLQAIAFFSVAIREWYDSQHVLRSSKASPRLATEPHPESFPSKNP